MTIKEAATLILQSILFDSSGDIFVLDMGKPVKIKFLAEQMILLSGKKIGRDVNIVYTGVRPGEKIHEEIFYSQEKLKKTANKKIFRATAKPYDKEKMYKIISALEDSISYDDNVSIIKYIKLLVPEYSVNNEKSSSFLYSKDFECSLNP